jgi:hypothetical protein
MSFELCACEYPQPVSDLLTEMHCQYKAQCVEQRLFRVLHKRVDNKFRIFILQNRTILATSADEALSLALKRAGVTHLSLRVDSPDLATAERESSNGLPSDIWCAEPVLAGF